MIPNLLAQAGPETPARIIVFTRFKDTLAYLEKELGRAAKYEIITLDGDLSGAEREKRYQQFAHSPCAVLLATDVISEGLNLQSAACMVTHYDLPWNPNRLDQRNGRVDRFGQRAPLVFVRTLFCLGTTDEDVMNLLVRKLDSMRRALGFSPPFFASEETVLRVLARRRTRRKAETGPSLFDAAEENAGSELFGNDAIERIRNESFYGQSQVRFEDVAEKLQEAHRQVGSPEQIHAFIRDGLTQYQCGVQENPNGTLAIQVRAERLRPPGMPTSLPSVVLDPEEQRRFPEAVVLDVGHPLIRRLNAVIREDAMRDTAEGARTAAWRVDGQRGTLLLAHGVLRAVAATDPPTLLEEVVLFGMRSGLQGYSLLTRDEAGAAYAQSPSVRRVDNAEALQSLTRLASSTEWRQAGELAEADSLLALQGHRARLASELRIAGDADTDWLKGFEQIERIGFDLICLTLLLP